MRLPWTPDFESERDLFALRFCCEDCGHFDPVREGCRHEWPNELHRLARVRPPWVDFCKEFELC